MNRTKIIAGVLAAVTAVSGGAAVAGAATGAAGPTPAAQSAPDRLTPGDVRDHAVDRATRGDARDGTVDRATRGDVSDQRPDAERPDGGADTDNVQSGDRSAPDATAEQGSEVVANDGPGGHADEVGHTQGPAAR